MAGIIDLRKANNPELRTVSLTVNLDAAETFGYSGLLASTESYKYIPAVSRDLQLIDVSAANPTPLVTLKDVRHRVTNNETGTTFFLTKEGLTVVRQTSVETAYKIHQMQMQGN
jgi:hypothetical protein